MMGIGKHILHGLTGALRRGWPRSREIPFPQAFASFKAILETNNQVLELMADMGDKQGGQFVFDRQYIISSCRKVEDQVQQIILELNKLAPNKYLRLYESFQNVTDRIDADLAGRLIVPQTPYIVPDDRYSGDLDEVVGNKSARLAEVRQVLGLPTPAGFMVTTRAFEDFMEHQGLRRRMRPVLEGWQAGRIDNEQASQAIKMFITQAELPESLSRALRHQAQALLAQHPGSLAVRSSATGEDGVLSFAGQYHSLLGVTAEGLPRAWRAVVASLYGARALEYRRRWQVPEEQVAMAVSCQMMVPARAAGVLYTLDPQAPEEEAMLISAGFGLGKPLVSGKAPADLYRVLRAAPHRVLGMEVVRKHNQLEPGPKGGTMPTRVEQGLQSSPALSTEQIAALAETAMRLEHYFKSPQDIEWALDQDGTLTILQVRPLNLKTQVTRLVQDIAAVLKDRPVLFAGRGYVAQRGIATGRVFLLRNDEDLNRFPDGGVLVSRFTSPRLGKVLARARGVITDLGSPTGHLATLAREYRVPTIVGTGIASQTLTPGMEVTLDAEQNVVYEGAVKELSYFQFTEDAFEESAEYRLLRRVLHRIAPLNLIDPQSGDFTARNCRTLHDIVRFSHEKAVDELIGLEDRRGLGSRARKLKLDIPLGLSVIDIGGGLDAPPGTGPLTLDQVASEPTLALLQGMSQPGAWGVEPMDVDFGSFMSSLTRTFAASLTDPRRVGQNLAVLSSDYVNLNLRLGYHFNIIDAYVGDDVSANYAYFRFQGGVTDLERRARRADFLCKVLQHHDFRVEVRGDLVVARIKKLPKAKMLERLRLLGRLVSYSRQLDVRMQSDENVNGCLKEFLTKGDGQAVAAA